VGGVEAQAVEVVFVQPMEGVFDEERPDHVAVVPIEVDGGAPGGACGAG
jgi:hypothetical protein